MDNLFELSKNPKITQKLPLKAYITKQSGYDILR